MFACYCLTYNKELRPGRAEAQASEIREFQRELTGMESSTEPHLMRRSEQEIRTDDPH